MVKKKKKRPQFKIWLEAPKRFGTALNTGTTEYVQMSELFKIRHVI
jgi:hypothetical protein